MHRNFNKKKIKQKNKIPLYFTSLKCIDLVTLAVHFNHIINPKTLARKRFVSLNYTKFWKVRENGKHGNNKQKLFLRGILKLVILWCQNLHP